MAVNVEHLVTQLLENGQYSEIAPQLDAYELRVCRVAVQCYLSWNELTLTAHRASRH